MIHGEVFTARKVDDWLNGVDYSDDPFYVPSDFALEFVTLLS